MRAAGILALSVLGLALPQSGRAAAPETDEQKTLYAIGVAMTRSTARFELTDTERQDFLRGLAEGLAGKAETVKPEEYGPRFESFANKRLADVAAREKTASQEFLEKAAAESGATKLPSGAIYLEKAAGKGDSPKPEDTIQVHYTGTLRDGKVFDSSVQRGQPENIQLGRTIECWKQTVTKMKVGGKAVVTCPADLAYGDRGTPNIKPGSALRFEIEVLQIVK